VGQLHRCAASQGLHVHVLRISCRIVHESEGAPREPKFGLANLNQSEMALFFECLPQCA